MPRTARSAQWSVAVLALALHGRVAAEPSEPACADNASFTDIWGFSCADWRGENCFAAADWWEYGAQDQADLLSACPASCGVCRLTEWGRQSATSFAAAVCRARLTNDTNCCLDTKATRKVRRHELHRPGTHWHCDNSLTGNCYDQERGERGADLLWVPETTSCSSPRMLYVHGGSFQFSSPRTDGYEVFVPKLARAGNVVTLALDYPLSPVATHRQMLSATLEALGYLVTHGPPGCTNEPSHSPPIFIAGDSSGGTLAYSALLTISTGRWSLPGNIRVAGALFFSPWMNMRCDTPSYLHNAHASVKLPDGGDWHNGDVAYRDFPAKSVADSLENAIEYLGDRALLDDPIASPILADREMLEDLPPLLFTVASNELIMGDAVISAQNAAAAGAPVILDIYEGMWHVFPMYSEGCGSGKPLWPAQRALRRAGRFLREVAATGRPPCCSAAADACSLGVPLTQIHTGRPGQGLPDFASGDGFPCRASTAPSGPQPPRLECTGGGQGRVDWPERLTMLSAVVAFLLAALLRADQAPRHFALLCLGVGIVPQKVTGM
jgi:acetyl esterase/lipase